MKLWNSLLGSRGIKRHGQAIVAGERIIREMVRNRPDDLDSLIIPLKWDGRPPQVPASVKVYRLEDALFRELDQFGTHYPLLVVRTPAIETFRPEEQTAAMTLFLPFQDPANLGAVIRSAAAFDVPSLVLLEEAASPYHPKCIRASGGAVFLVSFKRGPSINHISIPGIPLVGLSSDGEPLDRFSFPVPCALLPGMEGPGLPEAAGLDAKVAIPMAAGVESLNAAVAVSIALYEWKRETARSARK